MSDKKSKKSWYYPDESKGPIEVFVLVSVEPKRAMSTVEKKLVKLKRVKRIVEILGPYEILVKFRFKNQEEAGEVLTKLGELEGVKEVLVLIVTKDITKSISEK